MEIKKHYKLYKDGKNWCAMALAVTAVSAGLVLGNTNVKADTPTDNVPVVKTTNPTTGDANAELASQEKAAQAKDNGNYGYLDAAQVVNNNDLHVSGWQATNQAAGKDNRYLVAYDSTTNTELGRTPVTENVARPDVAKAYPEVVNAKDSGYQATMNNLDWSKVKSVDDQIHIVSRYSDAANGEGNHVDNWSQPINLDKGNYAYLDSFGVKDNQLQVSGWNATNKALGKKYHYVILYDRTAGHEITRVKVEPTVRPDVAKVCPSIYNSQKSGFNGEFKVDPAKANGTLKVIMRFAGNDANKDFSDQYSQDYPTNAGNFDNIHVTASQVTLSGWHASSQAANKPYEWLIALDENGQELYRQQITDKNITRNDVQRVYPYIAGANQSGFQITINNPSQIQGHTVRFIHRITDDNNGNGNYVDVYSNPVFIFPGSQTVGRKTTTYDANGQIIAVYNNADVISQLPELPTGCEITAVTMMLQYAGYNVNKVQLANIMPRSNNGNYGFVGNPFSPSGWWIFPTGIAPVVDQYVGHHEIMTGASMQRIQDKLKEGHLVVVWVANMNGFVNHALTLTGYDANRLYYNNPWTGRKESMTYGEFYQHWNADEQRAISY